MLCSDGVMSETLRHLYCDPVVCICDLGKFEVLTDIGLFTETFLQCIDVFLPGIIIRLKDQIHIFGGVF